MRRALPFAIVALTAAGCAPPPTLWARPGSSAQDFHLATNFCQSQAFARFPPFSLGAPGYFSTNQTQCTPGLAGPNCMIINPGYLPQARTASDINAGSREGTFRMCMMASGWRPVASPAEGDAVTKMTPRRDARWEDAVRRAMVLCDATLKQRGGDFEGCVTKRAAQLYRP